MQGHNSLDSVSPTINSENYRALVKQALEVFSGQAYDDRMVLFPHYTSGGVGQNIDPLVINCQDGGTYTRHFFATLPNRLDLMDASYDDCKWQQGGLANGDRVNGSFTDNFSASGNRMQFTGFSAQIDNDENSLMEVDGLYITSCCGDGTTHQTENLNYFFTYPQGTLRVSDATTCFTRQVGSQAEGSMQGGFTMQSGTGSFTDTLADIQVQTNIPFALRI